MTHFRFSKVFFLLVPTIFFSCKKNDLPYDEIYVDKTTISSLYTGSSYPVYIVRPQDFSTNNVYETIYVLDGDDELNGIKVYEQVARMCLNSSQSHNKQNVIVVAISALDQDERFRDYAPVPGTTNPKGVGGGTESYTKFLEYELIPYIQSNYPIDTTRKSRTICGHSLGGSVTGYFFVKHPDVFSTYLTLSPAFWWGDGVIMDYEKERRDSIKHYNTTVFVGCGDLEEGIRIYAEDWYYRLQNFYPNCNEEFNLENDAGHISSAKNNLTKAIDFYYNAK